MGYASRFGRVVFSDNPILLGIRPSSANASSNIFCHLLFESVLGPEGYDCDQLNSEKDASYFPKYPFLIFFLSKTAPRLITQDILFPGI
jgi:hypothetical protein